MAAGSRTGSIGVGTAISQLLGSEGCQVAVVDRDANAARATVDAIVNSGGIAISVVRDVTRDSECRGAVQETISAYGRIDILVNSLGIFMGAGPITSIPLERLEQTMSVNLTSMMLMARHVIPTWPLVARS